MYLSTKLHDVAHQMTLNILRHILSSITVETEKQPLLGNGCVTRDIGVNVASGVFCAIRAEVI
jgi:hypothetical protein